MPSSKMTQAELRQFRSQLAKLKSKGLAYQGKDIRSQKPTRHALRTIDKFRDVLDGAADVVSVPRGVSKKYDGYARTASKVVVPKVVKSERSRYDKKSGEIITSWKVPGGTVRTSRRKRSLEELRDLEGKGVSFSIYVRRGGEYHRYSNTKITDLAARFGPRSSFENWSDWLDFVNVDFFTGKAGAEPPPDEMAVAAGAKRKRNSSPKMRRGKRRVNATGRN